MIYIDAGVQEDQVLQQVYGNVELKIALKFTLHIMRCIIV